jgi:hypothetical protein
MKYQAAKNTITPEIEYLTISAKKVISFIIFQILRVNKIDSIKNKSEQFHVYL